MLVDINPDEWRCRSCDNLMSEPCKDCKPIIEAPAVDALTTGAVAKPVYLLRYKHTVIPPAKWEIVEKAEYEGAVDSYEKRILYAHPASEPKGLEKLFSEALSWGMTYGPVLMAEQWHTLRAEQAKKFAERALQGESK